MSDTLDAVPVYQPTGFAEQIFRDRYAIHPEETWPEACMRVADFIAGAEEGKKRDEFKVRFNQLLLTNRFSPGGRIWRGSGRPRGQLLNCFVLTDDIDSREGWGNTLRDVTIISGTGGGVGINFSRVRPRGSKIRGTGGEATGAVSLMRAVNAVCNELREGGGRRSALLFGLRYDHPDIAEFLRVKLDQKELANANISVLVDEHFFDLIEQDGDIVFEWQAEERGKMKAREMWDKIIRNACECGDPGILNIGLAQSMNNIAYLPGSEIVCTNPCITGDTKIHTVHEGAVSIRDLVGREVLVYSWDPTTKLPLVRWMRNIRCTRKNTQVVKVTFDSGLVVTCTPDHNFRTFRGDKVEASNLCVGQAVRAFAVTQHRDGHLRCHAWVDNKCAHQWVHRMVLDAYGVDVPDGHVPNHIDHDPTNNRVENLQVMTEYDHQSHHYPEREQGGFGRHGWNTPEDVVHRHIGDAMNAHYAARNHKVVSIEDAGFSDVFNGTVDDSHTYIIADPEYRGQDGDGIRFSGIVSCNCGEQQLQAFGSCDLGAVVLSTHVIKGEMDWDLLDETIRVGVRLLDNVLDRNVYPFKRIEDVSRNTRRIGLGVMGLHDALLEMGIRYSSDKGIEMVEQIMEFMKKKAYDASTFLAVEKGPFPQCDPEKFANSGFARRCLPPRIRNNIRSYGIRNCALLTGAPTGTTSIVAGVSSGIEPMFAPVYRRRFNQHSMTHDDTKVNGATEVVVHPLLARFIAEGRKISHFEGAHEISPETHCRVQLACQRHVDSSISKTINLPRDASPEAVSEILLKYAPKLKGVTVYRDGSKGQSPLEPLPIEAAKEHLDNVAASVDRCANGTCSL